MKKDRVQGFVPPILRLAQSEGMADADLSSETSILS